MDQAPSMRIADLMSDALVSKQRVGDAPAVVQLTDQIFGRYD